MHHSYIKNSEDLTWDQGENTWDIFVFMKGIVFQHWEAFAVKFMGMNAIVRIWGSIDCQNSHCLIQKGIKSMLTICCYKVNIWNADLLPPLSYILINHNIRKNKYKIIYIWMEMIKLLLWSRFFTYLGICIYW